MRKFIVAFVVLVIVAGFFTIRESMEGRVNRRVYPGFPESICPVYYVDTVDIPSAMIGLIDGDYYIFPEAAFEEYDGNDSLFLARRDVLLYFGDTFTGSMIMGGGWSTLSNRNIDKDYEFSKLYDGYADYLFEFNYIEMGKHNLFEKGIEVHRFDIRPKTFLIALIADSVDYDLNIDLLHVKGFSQRYILAARPVFTKKDSRRIRKKLDWYIKQRDSGKLDW